jgi:lysophospholipase L1-like esterase
MRCKLLLLTISFTIALPEASRAYTVHDPIHTTLNVLQQVIGQTKQALQHAEVMAKYAQMLENQAKQIEELTTVINQNVESLRRLGDPNTYINMLGLNDLFNEITKIKSGVGNTVAQFQQTANGALALKNTANGLYRDLSSLPDRFGQQIKYNADSFKPYATVQDMYQTYNSELEQGNQSLANLQQQKQDALQQLNQAGSLIEVEKLKAKLTAIQTGIDNVLNRVFVSAQKVLVQTAANQNDEARRQEAARQQIEQEMREETQELQQGGKALLQAFR